MNVRAHKHTHTE